MSGRAEWAMIDYADAGSNVGAEIRSEALARLGEDAEDFCLDLAVAALPDDVLAKLAELALADGSGIERSLFAIGLTEEIGRRAGEEFGS